MPVSINIEPDSPIMGRRVDVLLQRSRQAVPILFLSVLVCLFSGLLPTLERPGAAVLLVGIYVLSLKIFGRPEIGAWLFIIFLLNVTLSSFFPVPTLNLGFLVLPSPLMGITVLTLGAGFLKGVKIGAVSKIIRISWLPIFVLILLIQAVFILLGHGTGVEFSRLGVTAISFISLVMVMLVYSGREKLVLLIRFMVVSYFFFSLVNTVLSLQTGIGFRGLEGDGLNNMASTSAAGILNIFLPVGFAMVLIEKKAFWKLVSLCAVGACTTMLFLTTTRGGLIGLAIMTLGWLLLGRRYLSRWFFLVLISIPIVFLALNTTYTIFVSSSNVFGGSGIGELRLTDYIGQMVWGDGSNPMSPGNYYDRMKIFMAALDEIVRNPFMGIGANRVPSHSLLLATALDGGIFYMLLWTLLLLSLLYCSYRRWRYFRMDQFWGPLTLGLFLSTAFVVIQSTFDVMLFGLGYALLFWFVQGIGTVLDVWVRNRRGRLTIPGIWVPVAISPEKGPTEDCLGK